MEVLKMKDIIFRLRYLGILSLLLVLTACSQSSNPSLPDGIFEVDINLDIDLRTLGVLNDDDSTIGVDKAWLGVFSKENPKQELFFQFSNSKGIVDNNRGSRIALQSIDNRVRLLLPEGKYLFKLFTSDRNARTDPNAKQLSFARSILFQDITTNKTVILEREDMKFCLHRVTMLES